MEERLKIIQEESSTIDSLINDLALLDNSAFLRKRLYLRMMEMFPVETEEIIYRCQKANRLL